MLEIMLTAEPESEKEESSTHTVTLPKNLTDYTFQNLPEDKKYQLRLFSRNGKEISECRIKAVE